MTAEATVNQVISRRMVKKQQMRWSPRGAHLLLQVRTCALNDDLAADFARWYPGLGTPDQRQLVDGRVLVRPSGTEPAIRLMVQAADAGLAEQVIGQLAAEVRLALGGG